MSMYVKFSDPTIAGLGANCSIVALRQVLPASVTDDQILAAARARGYRQGHGIPYGNTVLAGQDLGLRVEKFELSWDVRLNLPRTLATYVDRFLQEGTYLVFVPGHVLVVRNGQVVDPNVNRSRGGRRRVIEMFRVLNDAYVEPKKAGILRVNRGSRTRRSSFEGHQRYWAMTNYVLENPGATPSQIIANTAYTKGDLAYDLKHGNVEII